MTAKFHVTEHTAIKDVSARLTQAFSRVVPDRQIDETVQRIHHRFDDSKIRDFIPLLVENAARNELRTRVQANGTPSAAPEPTTPTS